jgi:hypothetical protein
MGQVTTIDTNNYELMAKAMGIANEGSSEKSSTLPRLRLIHSPILGDDRILVKGGSYKLDVPNGETYYAPSIKIRPYMQRFMYKRFIKGNDKQPNRYVKTIMADDLNMDLKDNDGGFNCGKPAGYIKDFQALPAKMQDLIKQIKRVRVVLGTVELQKPIDERGKSIELEEQPFIWEIDNRDAFKNVGASFTQLAKMKRLPVQHIITANSEERKLPNGNSFFLPVVSLDLSNTLALSNIEQEKFGDFMAWIDNYNSYISNAWSEKANSKMEEEDMDVIDNLVDIEIEDDEDAA